MRTTVYVDGYNFYYGCCRNTPYKWLNLRNVSEILLPAPHVVDQIYYFTAAIKSPPHNPHTRYRQYLYWRALRTVPGLTIVEGSFLEQPKYLPWAEPRRIRLFKNWLCKFPRIRPYIGHFLVRVWRTEEKSTDVNLATQLLMDAVDDKFDCAVVISNDSDLIAPIKMVRERFKKQVGILTGHHHPSKTLQKEVNFLKVIREGVLRDSQFPDTITDKTGTFTRPAGW